MNHLAFALQALLVFGAAIVLDWIWANYIRYTAAKDALRAGFWASMTIVAGAFIVVEYIHNLMLLPFAALGSFVGTYAAIKWSIRKDSSSEASGPTGPA